MAITINNNSPKAQYSASGGQTAFTGNWRIEDNTDIKVYLTPVGQSADDTTDILILTTDYTISGLQTDSGFTVTLVNPATLNDVVTILDDRDFESTYAFSTNNKFNPVVFNEIFAIQDSKIKQLRMEIRKLKPRYQNSEVIGDPKDRQLPILVANQGWVMNAGGTEIQAITLASTALTRLFYAETTGSANTYSLTITDSDFPGYTDGLAVVAKINVDSTGATTLDINSLGVRSVLKNGGVSLESGDFQDNSSYLLVFRDNAFYLNAIPQSGICKAWGNVDASVPSLAGAYNIASVTTGGVGLFTVNFTNNFTSSDYVITTGVVGTSDPVLSITAQNPSTFSVRIVASTTGVLITEDFFFSCFGDLA